MPEPGLAPRRRRAAVLAAACALALLSQARYLPERAALVREAAAYAGRSFEDAQRRAFHPASYDLVEWVRRETPPDAVLLLVTSERRPRGSEADVLFHRALVHLHPRRVVWVTPAAERVYPEWWLTADTAPGTLARIAREAGATAVLAHGFDAPPLAGPTRSFDARSHLTFAAHEGRGAGHRWDDGRRSDSPGGRADAEPDAAPVAGPP